MALEFKECPNHGWQSHRDGECLACRPIETFNLFGAAPVPGVMAAISTHLERYGKITITCSALSEFPGRCALLLGEQYAKAEMERK